MRILITGGSGFVGSYLAETLVSEGHQVISIDTSNGNIADFNITNQQVSKFNPDVIYHLAALAHVPTCEAEFEKALSINVTGTYNLLKAAKSLSNPPRVIFISSANVYGIVKEEELPLTEQSSVKPDNNYALTKVMAEEIVLKYGREVGKSVVIFRSFNHLGPRQAAYFMLPSFVKQLVAIKNKSQEPIIKVGNLSAKRDFTDVRDIVRAYFLALSKGSGIYNLCSQQTFSIQDLLDKLLEILALKVEIVIDPALYRNNDLPILVGDNSRAKNDLGWKPEITINQTLLDIISEYQHNS